MMYIASYMYVQLQVGGGDVCGSDWICTPVSILHVPGSCCVRVKAKAVLHSYGSLPPPSPLGYVEDGVLVVYVIACVYDGIASVS